MPPARPGGLAQQAREHGQFLLGLYGGVALLFGAAALASGLWLRDGSFLAFAACLLLLGLIQFARAGLAPAALWPQPHGGGLMLAGVEAATALWFVRTVTEPERLAPRLALATRVMLVALLGGAAAEALRGDPSSRLLLLAVLALALLLTAALAWEAARRGEDPALRLFALSWLPLTALAALPLGWSAGLVPDHPLVRHGLLAGLVLETPLLFHVLNARALRRREAAARAAALARTDALTGLPLRAPFVERLAEASALARAAGRPCAILVVRVADLPGLEARHGPAAARQALVLAGAALTRAAGEADVAARLGEQSFGLLLAAPAEPASVLARAQQVVADGLRPPEGLPPREVLRLQVVAALLPHGALGPAASVQWALDAVAHWPAGSRKLIRALNFAPPEAIPAPPLPQPQPQPQPQPPDTG